MLGQTHEKYRVARPLGVINIGTKLGVAAFFLKRNVAIKNFKSVIFFEILCWIQICKTLYIFFNILLFLVSFLALSHSIFIFFKALLRFEFCTKFQKKLCVTWNFKKCFFGGPYGDFSDIKSSIRNRTDDFGGRLVDF